MTTIYAEASSPDAAGHQDIILMAGGNGPIEEVAKAAKLLELCTPLFIKSDPPGAMVGPLTWPAVVQLQATFGAAWSPGPQLVQWVGEQIAARTSTAPLTCLPGIPAGLTPYPWQVEGAQMIAATGRALITDEPGTGKTMTAILGLLEWGVGPTSARQSTNPVLVVCPASVVDPWVDAWRTWAPQLTAVAWRGTPTKRAALAGTADVYVVSYETCRQDAPPSTSKQMAPLRALAPVAVVIDECHLIKNKTTARSSAVRRLAHRAQAVVALSGTPITHHPGDLWPTLDAIEHDAWPSSTRWIKRYCQTLQTDYREEILGLNPATEPEFRTTLLGQHRRVAKADVLTQLPEKVYSVRTVELSKSWRKVYDDFEEQMLADLPEGGELSVMDVMSQYNFLTRLASSAADVEITYGPELDDKTGEPKRHIHLTLKAPSPKVDALLEVLEERPGQPVVAFAPSSQLVRLAGVAAAEAGLRVGYVIGSQSQKERTATVASFQAGELDLLCVTTGAGGVGLTLTAARTVVFLQRPWSLVESIQAEDRCHRIGSEIHDSIEVIDVVANNTIDTRVRAVLRERAGQLADLVQDPRIALTLLGGADRDTHEERKIA